ncbi:hypothetical protein B0H13DRAFT_2579110 [Mycena leptocephala]|nr:hypothetical protein B0H13DRAFT_2579110 [Mycena leptocephala]
MALASTDLLLTVPFATFVLYSNVAIAGLSRGFHEPIRTVTLRGKRGDAEVVDAECALLFFAYFGFADEAIKNYRGVFNSVAQRVGYTTGGGGLSGLSSTGCFLSSLILRAYLLSAQPQIPTHVLLWSCCPPRLHPKDTQHKRDSFDSFSNMSTPYGGVSPLEYDAEKTRMLGAGEYDGGEKLTLGDVSGMLPDYEASDYSSSPSSASSDSASSASSVYGEEEEGEEEAEIEVSPLHRASVTLPSPYPSQHMSGDRPVMFRCRWWTQLTLTLSELPLLFPLPHY